MLPASIRVLGLTAVVLLLSAQTADPLFAPLNSEHAWAVIVGISRYQNLDKEKWLDHADADAQAFQQFITSRQGLNFREDHVFTLINEQATRGKIISAVSTKLVQRVKPGDSVYLFFAAHGVLESFGPRDPYLIAYDSKMDDLAADAVSFADVQDIAERRVGKNVRVMIMTDACHAGKIADTRDFSKRLSALQSDVFGLLASAPEESSVEGTMYGGGHGAFTFQLLKGLQGDADSNHDGMVEFSEASAYLKKNVPPSTSDRQHPQAFGKPPVDYALSLVNEQRADLGFGGAPENRLAELIVAGPAGTEVFVNGTSRGAVKQDGKLAIARFPPDNYRVMAVDTHGARAVQDIQVSGDPTEVRFDGKSLWTTPAKTRGFEDAADEDAAQQILVAYLKGNAVRLTAADFDRCADLYGRVPNARAKQAFCAGRAAVERRDYNGASQLLDESIRLDGKGGYAYNARGLSKLAQNDLRGAIADFDTASANAPRWPYPHFNAALAWTSLGQTARAEQEYQRAIVLGPRYAYLHYNLATLYMRINQPARAEQEYRRALELDLDQSAGHDALGLFFRSRNRAREAESEFRRALQIFDGDVAGYVNLARLFRDQRQPAAAERELLAGAARVQSPLIQTALGDLYTEMKRPQDAAAAYRKSAELERQP